MDTFINEIKKEVKEHILPFWISLKDDKYGGFYGTVDYNLNIKKNSDKGGIATARYLWSFSNAYKILGDKKYLLCANHAYNFLVKYVYDQKHKGIYWMLDYKGNVVDERKHIYAQAFAIYALSEYYKVTNNKDALNLAIEIFELIESKGYNKINNCYKEEFTRDWIETKNYMLSENGVIANITMNTHLHILEAYTNLYKVYKDTYVYNALNNLINIFYIKFFDKNNNYFKVFFDNQWNELINLQSYGHDIEASWLIDDALRALNINNHMDMVIGVANNIINNACLEDGSIAYECYNGKKNLTKVWWVQAEAIVGFFNAYIRTKEEKYLKQVYKTWRFTCNYIIDKREKGEWFWSVNEYNKPNKECIAEPWKTPYHNTRCCLKIIERMKDR